MSSQSRFTSQEPAPAGNDFNRGEPGGMSGPGATAHPETVIGRGER
ncbi:hypothetical protein ACKI1I_29580 [Streptomyces turgidiscabies]|uniref:Uncharacterized protein n=1 Tax=Streptomyces turgidiscabies (strain Car8) TaxID=698760 RepID=L7FEN6_STRT8|nr:MULTISPECIES: hypothetical protein [Streptomyces]ELP69782.1 hypothetical protein STRTUCAR8_00868 [Streptomyces turgidiscabies Car8]MDX3496379.1 hypothetical protein [Streptomyces turgidiscabies]GAQ75051.1 hypothetical protein T45_06832 [Streptomyces turgidiscabies]